MASTVAAWRRVANGCLSRKPARALRTLAGESEGFDLGALMMAMALLIAQFRAQAHVYSRFHVGSDRPQPK
jgi:hypothetical protein